MNLYYKIQIVPLQKRVFPFSFTSKNVDIAFNSVDKNGHLDGTAALWKSTSSIHPPRLHSNFGTQYEGCMIVLISNL